MGSALIVLCVASVATPISLAQPSPQCYAFRGPILENPAWTEAADDEQGARPDVNHDRGPIPEGLFEFAKSLESDGFVYSAAALHALVLDGPPGQQHFRAAALALAEIAWVQNERAVIPEILNKVFCEEIIGDRTDYRTGILYLVVGEEVLTRNSTVAAQFFAEIDAKHSPVAAARARVLLARSWLTSLRSASKGSATLDEIESLLAFDPSRATMLGSRWQARVRLLQNLVRLLRARPISDAPNDDSCEVLFAYDAFSTVADVVQASRLPSMDLLRLVPAKFRPASIWAVEVTDALRNEDNARRAQVKLNVESRLTRPTSVGHLSEDEATVAVTSYLRSGASGVVAVDEVLRANPEIADAISTLIAVDREAAELNRNASGRPTNWILFHLARFREGAIASLQTRLRDILEREVADSASVRRLASQL
ncbi:MAG: hypothetical protein HYV07_19125 [Deltaproteobacteria bacterium]|nr:hypothetical protein [Deltaproteobacteria bacterium]